MNSEQKTWYEVKERSSLVEIKEHPIKNSKEDKLKILEGLKRAFCTDSIKEVSLKDLLNKMRG